MCATRKCRKGKPGREGRKREQDGKWKQFRKVCRLTGRAHGMLCREAGGLLFFTYLEQILYACIPYWDIYFSARLLDEILGERRPGQLVLFMVLILGSLPLWLLADLVRGITKNSRFSFTQKQRMIFANKIMGLDYDRLEDENTHLLFKRVERETFNDGKNLTPVLRMGTFLVGDLVSMGLSVALVWEFLVGFQEKVVILGLAAAVGIFTWVSARCFAHTEKLWLKCNDEISENCLERDGYLHYFSQYARGKEIRIFGLGSLMRQKLLATHHFNDKALDRRNRKSLPFDSLGSVAQEAVGILVDGVMVLAALAGKITVGGMTQYASSVRRFLAGIEGLSMEWMSLWYNADYLERYFSFLDIPSAMGKGCIPVEKRADREYQVVFDHVSFRYPGSDTYALKDICMEFQIGEKLAVVGMNGSGKSTFIKLLCRLYDPTEGTIYVNGIDIRRYDYQEYLALFSVVFQDFKLFSFSLGENVAVSEEYRPQEVWDALDKAGLEDFGKGLPEGLETVLYRDFDRKGLEVSGGEAQKIALARAVCKGSPFVLLDEPTAALDPLAEYEIYSRFNELVQNRTTVYISHRMSSCRFCGDIAVFHQGRLVQRGSHETLMKETEGKYYELWTAQAKHYV